AVRWSRTALGLAEADPDAHALVARALLAAHENTAAADELAKALASRPHDPALERELARVRRHGPRPSDPTARPKRARAVARATTEDAPAADDDSAAKTAPVEKEKTDDSAPGEPAAE
ncbi:MAG TPA: hypothetical protein VHJ20_11470, partial [Polyangia bacterium]|nr:hypothetical protein [Polyangia bacterium]